MGECACVYDPYAQERKKDEVVIHKLETPSLRSTSQKTFVVVTRDLSTGLHFSASSNLRSGSVGGKSRRLTDRTFFVEELKTEEERNVTKLRTIMV
ncbi:hypothetical protein JTE90_010687 [Oedothorax gibbosus]|uniref:Uncharacterized protein n=1 Tax=Oedothorax gibbosus TaxID=931172 RepID=A0AAV6UST0_9ARAC|nr:hypothetical protein JTE90_010687 [Oedothorax gibbosus]